MSTESADLCIEINVHCPKCYNYINLLDEGDTNGVKFDYVSGIHYDHGAERVYHNKEIGVQVNLWTPKKRGKWGQGVKSYSLIGTKQFYDSYEELLEKAA